MTFETTVIHIHRQTAAHTNSQSATHNSTSPFCLSSFFFAREGGVRKGRGWVGVKVSIPAGPEWSRGHMGGDVGVAVAELQGRRGAKSSS